MQAWDQRGGGERERNLPCQGRGGLAREGERESEAFLLGRRFLTREGLCVCVCVSIQAFHESLNGALSQEGEKELNFSKGSPPFIVKSRLNFHFAIFIFRLV